MYERVVVIGAGAAGLFAAWKAASEGAKVTLLEKNDRIGIKILISGGGKCNITHDGPLEGLIKAFRPNEARFIRPSCYRFTNADVVEMLTSRGLAVYTRPDGRIFPTEGNARDVVAIFGQVVEEAGAIVKLNCAVTGIAAANGQVNGVRLGDHVIETNHVVLAVGGMSYPGTGTTGDGYAWVRDLGHTVVKVRAALAPLFLEVAPVPEWPGVSLRDCVLKARQAGKVIDRWQGDMLFTHRGVSGPTALGISRVVAEHRANGPIQLEVDLFPDQSYEALTATLQKWCKQFSRRRVLAWVEEQVPKAIAPAILSAADVSEETAGAYLARKELNRLVATLKAWNFGDVQHVPMEKGEVCAGGVSLDEVDPHTMRSKVVRGLYLCGEILDVAGPVGGYNLQAAFSTGYVAGESAAKDFLASKA